MPSSSIKVGFAALTALLLVVITAPARADDTARAFEIGAEGSALYSDGKYAEAAGKFLEAYKLSPEAHNFIYNTARAYHKLGELELARKYYELAIDKASAESDRWDWWGKAHEYLDEVKKALAEKSAATENTEDTTKPAEPKPDLTVNEQQPDDDPTVVPDPPRDRDEPGSGKSRNWLLVAAGGAAIVGALIFDTVPEGANDKEFSGWDLLPVVGYAAGAGLVWRGAF